ncbi:MAG: hypothetical protein ABIQ31_01290 [Ferruginibacter sp.]
MKKKWIVLLLATVIIIQSSCSKNEDASQATVKTYVIVPGSWSAPYAWQIAKSYLKARGQKVFVVQLPGHGTDQTTIYKTLTLDKYRDYVVNVITR